MENWITRGGKNGRLIKTDLRRTFIVWMGNMFYFDCYRGKGMVHYVYRKRYIENRRNGCLGEWVIIKLLVIIGCIVFMVLVEYVYNLYLDTLPKDQRNELIKRQSKMRCSNGGTYGFEIIGMKHGRAIFQCRHSKKAY